MKQENSAEETSQKSEKPTPHRLEKARQKGSLPQTRDLYHVVVLGVFFLFVWLYGKSVMITIFKMNQGFLSAMGAQECDGAALRTLLQDAMLQLGKQLGFFFITLMGGVILGAVAQFGGRLHFVPLRFDVQKLSLIQNAKKIFSLRQLIEFFKNFIKFLMVGGVIFWGGLCVWPFVSALSGADLGLSVYAMDRVVRFLLLSMVVGVLFLAVIDYGYQWWVWFKKLFMSRQELVEEQKELEKDPLTSSRQKQMRKEWGEMKKAREKVPDATLLITNPTHYAVALLWVPHKMMAPEVLFKGHDKIARYMRTLAENKAVPVIENKPLAQSLYRDVPTGAAIHPQHYKAVAEVIYYVMNLKHKRRRNSS